MGKSWSLVWAVVSLRLQGRKLELAEVVGALVGRPYAMGAFHFHMQGRVSGVKALASMEEFKESKERVPPAEAGRSPGQEDKCCLLPEHILSLLFPETRTEYLLGMSFQWC